MTILMGVMVSFYFFPIEFTFLPGINTKMAMAGGGLVVLFIQLARQRMLQIDNGFFNLSLIALAVSFLGFVSVAYNETYDYTYATYIVSMWVWLSGAYVVVTTMRALHGYMSVKLVCNYFIAICAAQCISALIMDFVPLSKEVIDTYVSGYGYVDASNMTDGGRLYGIGAGLDVGGLKFSASLVVIAHVLVNTMKNKSFRLTSLYFTAFAIITIVGNMIARTTTVGVILAFFYWLYVFYKQRERIKPQDLVIWSLPIMILLIAAVAVTVHFYNTNDDFRANIRFAFEGFFSLWNDGVWYVSSNENLKNMYVFPQSMKTWLIGDGYMENPRVTDPFYTGKVYSGYYMGTDVGYLRFIFYFGMPGLITFIYFFVVLTRRCMNKFPAYKIMFLFLLFVNLMGWFKVSTDIFMIFAPFLLISSGENEEGEQRLLINDNTRSVHE